jgi:ApaG protein
MIITGVVVLVFLIYSIIQYNAIVQAKVRVDSAWSQIDVQLQRRFWNIFDSISERREVEGAGVVGQQPILRPGEVYEYESACNLKSEFGKMDGTYTFERIADGEKFNVVIPEFRMVVPYRLN